MEDDVKLMKNGHTAQVPWEATRDYRYQIRKDYQERKL